MASKGKGLGKGLDALIPNTVELKQEESKYFLNVLPKTVKNIAVLDRTKESGAKEPLYLDVSDVITESGRKIKVIGGRYGLSSKNTTTNPNSASN